MVIENYEKGALDHERDQSAQLRHANLEFKLRKDRPNGAVGPSVSLEELQMIRATQGIGTASLKIQVNHYTVYYECRRSDSKHVDQMLGTGVIFFAEVNTMLGAPCSAMAHGYLSRLPGVLALRSRIVKEVNGRWTEFYSTTLLEYVTLVLVRAE